MVKFLATLLLMGIATSSIAQTQTAFLKGENTTGMTKQCYYDSMGSAYTRTVSAAHLCPISIQVPAPHNARPGSSDAGGLVNITAFKTGEVTTGMTKQCFYNALGSQVTRTISASALCPISIQVRR